MATDTRAYSLHMTKATIMKEGNRVRDSIPVAHNRKRYELAEMAMIQLCKAKRTPLARNYKVGDHIVYIQRINLGTKKYPYVFAQTLYDTVTKVNPNSVATRGRDIIPYDKILGIYTERASRPKTNSAGLNIPSTRATKTTTGMGLPKTSGGFPNVRR